MAALRFLSALFLLVAVIALVSDATPPLTGEGPFVATSLGERWAELAPSSRAAAKSAITQSTAAWVWDPLIASLLNCPTFVFFAALGAAAGYAGRRRRHVNIYVN